MRDRHDLGDAAVRGRDRAWRPEVERDAREEQREPDDREPLRAEVRGERAHVLDEHGHAVRGHRARARRLAVAAQVDRDGLVVAAEVRELRPPQPPELGEAVQEEDVRPARAGAGDVQARAVHRRRLVRDGRVVRHPAPPAASR